MEKCERCKQWLVDTVKSAPPLVKALVVLLLLAAGLVRLHLDEETCKPSELFWSSQPDLPVSRSE